MLLIVSLRHKLGYGNNRHIVSFLSVGNLNGGKI